MSYRVLARKWRPQTLTDVLGQEHVTQTLTNALRSGRIAQTFLFSGPRGVGKTSSARILAKALCCASSDGPTPEPCGTCPQCVSIAEGSSTDVIELDAASNTQVDRVREVIIDSVRYLPASARFKVYIIDEVHMLSQGSFNALLKTFEEPPDHAKFILATTELHKIPITIQSRCQRYDFRLVAAERIRARLSEILDAEQVAHDPGALALVARFADGSMRDAQSVLEQVLAYAGDRSVDGALVREALGTVETVIVEGTFEALLGRDPGEVIQRVAEVHDRGLSHGRFAASLVEHARDLVVARVSQSPEAVIHRPAEEVERLKSQAQPHRVEALERLFEQLSRIQDEVARSPQPRYALEVGLAGLASAPPEVPVDQLLGQLERLERVLGHGGRPASGGARPGPARFEGGGGGGRGARAKSPPRREPGEPDGADPEPTEPRRRPNPPAAVGATPKPSEGPARAEGPAEGPPSSSNPPASAGGTPKSSGVPARAEGPAGGPPPKPVSKAPPEAPKVSNDRPWERLLPPEERAELEASRRGGPRAPVHPHRSSNRGPAPRPEAPPDDRPPWERGPPPEDRPPWEQEPPPEPEPPLEDRPPWEQGPPPEPEPPLEDRPPWDEGPPSPPRRNGPARADRARSDRGESGDPAAREGRLEVRYRAFVRKVQQIRPSLGAVLHQVRPLRFEPGAIELACETAFDEERLSAAESQRVVQEAGAAFFGGPLELTIRLRGGGRPTRADGAPRTLIEVEHDARQSRIEAKQRSALESAEVALVQKELGARILRVTVLGEDEGTT